MSKVVLTPAVFYNGLVEEVELNSLGLSEEDHTVLRRYYQAMIHNPEQRPFYRYNWQRRTAPMVDLLQSLPPRDKPWRILDAGCGVGTESLLWSTLRNDAEVVGVEIKPERLAAAVARREKHEAQMERSLSCDFLLANVFDLLATDSYEIIWTMEAISHIDPAEMFLAAAFQSLTPGGHLVISDSHLPNPAMLWRIYNLRRQGVRMSQKRLPDGELISYAEERLFAVPTLEKLMRQAGFHQVQSQMSVFFPPFVARYGVLLAYCVGADAFLNRLPWVRYLGGIYTLVGTKP